MQPLIISRQFGRFRRSADAALERFRAKWAPVRVKKTRQNNRLEPGSDSIRTDKALALAGLSLLALALGGDGARAQNVAKPVMEAAPQAVPGFWDPRRRPDRPDLSRLAGIPFLTETAY